MHQKNLMSSVQYCSILGDYPQVYTGLYSSLDEYQSPFKGTVRTPTVVPSRRQGQSRLLAPFYDGYTIGYWETVSAKGMIVEEFSTSVYLT